MEWSNWILRETRRHKEQSKTKFHVRYLQNTKNSQEFLLSPYLSENWIFFSFRLSSVCMQTIKYHASQTCECPESLKCLKEFSNIPPQKLAVIVGNLVHNWKSRNCFQSVSILLKNFPPFKANQRFSFFFFLIDLKYGFSTKMKNKSKIKLYWELEKPPTSD